MNLYVFQSLNGLGLGMIYFLTAVGLSIIFGLLNFVNFAHGAFFLIGGYVAFEISARTGNFYVALLVAPLCVAGIGWALNKFLLNRVMQMSHSAHILITFGIMLVLREIVVSIWGPLPRNLPMPQGLNGVLVAGHFVYPYYRLFVIGLSVLVGAGLWLLLEGTRFGALLRAASQDPSTVSLIGVDVSRIFSAAFALGGWLAGLAGVLAAPMRGVDPGMGVDALAIAFAVVIVGGLGSWTGALVGALLVGLVQSLMTTIWPEGARLMIYGAVAVVLLCRPNGLLGRA